MKPATETLEAKIQYALREDAALSAEEITAVMNKLSGAYHTAHIGENPKTILANLRYTSSVLAYLLYVVSNNLLQVQGGNTRSLERKIGELHQDINSSLSEYVHANVYQHPLLSHKTLIKTLTAIMPVLQKNTELSEIYAVLQPCLESVISAKQIHYHRWLWWTQFAGACGAAMHDVASFRGLLVSLNFNTMAFIGWLSADLMKEIEDADAPLQKSAMLLKAITNYERCRTIAYGYKPAEPSVRHAIVVFLKRELFCFLKLAVAGQDPSKTGLVKLNTVLSVPQLALLTRLMVETKILNESNQTALLKTIATAMATSKAAAISSTSLRVNYYTPNVASKQIVKEYLLQMMRLLNTY